MWFANLYNKSKKALFTELSVSGMELTSTTQRRRFAERGVFIKKKCSRQ